MQNSNILARLSSSAGRIEPHAFANPENMFAHDYVQLLAISKYVLKKVGNEECSKELKIECAHFLGQTSFGHIDLISDPLTVSKFNNETHDPKGQENKVYTIVKGKETFYHRHTVPITSCCEVKFVLKKVIRWNQRMHERTERQDCSKGF